MIKKAPQGLFLIGINMKNNDYLYTRVPLISTMAPEASASVSGALNSNKLNNSDKLVITVLFLELLQTDLDYVEMSYKDIKIRVSTISKSSFRRSLAKLKSLGFIFIVTAPGRKSRIYLAKSKMPKSKLYSPVTPVGVQTSAASDTSRQKPVPPVTPVDMFTDNKLVSSEGSVTNDTTQNIVCDEQLAQQDIDNFAIFDEF